MTNYKQKEMLRTNSININLESNILISYQSKEPVSKCSKPYHLKTYPTNVEQQQLETVVDI